MVALGSVYTRMKGGNSRMAKKAKKAAKKTAKKR
jgi:hypothetical protein